VAECNARVKGYRSKPLVQNQIYRIAPGSGIVDAMADGFTLPNGLAFSEDEKLLYVTDAGYK
jgi:gluconolactonase